MQFLFAILCLLIHLQPLQGLCPVNLEERSSPIGEHCANVSQSQSPSYLRLDNQTIASPDDLLDDPFLVLRSKTSKNSPMNLKDSWQSLAKLMIHAPRTNIPNAWEQTSSSQLSALSLLKNLRVAVLNQHETFDHQIPYFKLQCEGSGYDKVWWQISADANFSSIIPNFDSIQDFESEIHLDELTNTFFNPGGDYFFRARIGSQDAWSEWCSPFHFQVNKPMQVQNICFDKTLDGTFEISWEKSCNENVRYFIFASNALDFIPCIYCDKQINEIDAQQISEEHNSNLLLVTSQDTVTIDPQYAYYRIIAECKGHYSVPSPLIYVYDYGLTHNRTVLCALPSTLETDENEGGLQARRIELPPAQAYSDLNYAFTGELTYKGYVCPPAVSSEVWESVNPYLLPENHPIKSSLDHIFTASRVIQSKKSMVEAGFTIISSGKFSHVIVASHLNLKGYIVKLFLDSEPKVMDWSAWKNRILGALSIKNAIDRHGWKDVFKVAKKWIYPLPPSPNTGSHPSHPKNFILIVQDMQILKSKSNFGMWKSPSMTREKLDKIYVLLQEEGLWDSVYPFNFPFCKDGRLAIVDTEYHHRWPIRFSYLTNYLCPSLQKYWVQLIKAKGPQSK